MELSKTKKSTWNHKKPTWNHENHKTHLEPLKTNLELELWKTMKTNLEPTCFFVVLVFLCQRIKFQWKKIKIFTFAYSQGRGDLPLPPYAEPDHKIPIFYAPPKNKHNTIHR